MKVLLVCSLGLLICFSIFGNRFVIMLENLLFCNFRLFFRVCWLGLLSYLWMCL